MATQIQITPSSDIEVGTTPVTSGTDGRIFFQDGGVVQQDGALLWDNTNKRLGVGGTAASRLTIQGTATSDSGQLGSELLTTGTGTNWTGTDFATGYTHVTGSTADLTSTLAAVVNNYYQITYTVTGRTAGSFTIAFGGFTSGNLTATGEVGPRATTTGTVVITPTSDFDGTIVLSIRVISASAASVTFNSSTGTLTNEIRISSLNSNTFIGRLAGSRNTTGTNNTVNGVAALQNNTTGASNTANGAQALLNNTTGTQNTANGQSALFSNTTGGGNTANGVSALQNNTTGASNIALGVNAGRFITGGSTANTITNNSVFLGFDTRAGANNQTNQIVIGFQATGLGSNTAVIGNSSTTLFRPFGNVAIGADTAGARLDVRAQGALSTDLAFRVRNSADTLDIFSVSGNNTIKLLADPSATYGIAISAGSFAAPIMTFSDFFSERIRISAVTQTIKADHFRMGAETGNGFGGLITTSTSPAQGRFFRIIDNFGTQWLNIGGSSFDGNSIGMSIRANTNTNANYINFNGFQNINPVVVSDNACVGIGGTSYGTSSKNVIAQYTGTAPTSSPADAFQQYSADITAGNAAPHFRTEAGDVIKLYKETTGVAAATLVGGGGTTLTDTDTFDGYTMQQVVKALRNLGILA
jgi:hypothetical protein